MFSVDTSQLSALGAEITAAAAKVTPLAGVAVRESADEAFELSQSLVPVLTGELRASGHVEQTGPLSAEVVYDAEHAVYVEYGTSDTAPQPFIGPAADPAAETLVDGLLDIAGRLL